MKRLCGWPRRFSLTTTPFTRKRLSNDCAPEITTCLFGPASLTPGASSAAVAMLRLSVGSSASASPVKFVLISVVSSAAGADAVTVISSLMAAGRMSTSARLLCVRLTRSLRVTVERPLSSNVTV
jgi:hypothetical protein